ncbi:NAD(P)-dependent oxidoreductase [Actinomadura hibisca]|uniref:NAD(P)-dependent oxidoreductase n=1 Tax=Actinomadura hibisca TaxID=68565 RepID=UPI00083372D5|nr:NAD(P)-binding domain-containing protein [Actinomadura hibisca]
MNLTPVTVLGLGSMGHALASAFVKAGHPTTVWNRTPGKAADLVAAGATEAATAAEAVTASPLVIAVLLDDAVARGVLGSAADALPGRVLANLTNGTPAQARETAAWATGLGASYLDGGIMATPPLIGGPASFVLYSGDRAAFEQHEGALKVLGDAKYLDADPGTAPLYDMALLSGMYGLAAGVEHAFAMVGAERAAAFGAELLVPWLQAMAGVFAGPAAADMEADSPLGMQAAALDNIVRASRGENVPRELEVHLLTMMRQIVSAGHTSVLPPLIAEISGRPTA